MSTLQGIGFMILIGLRKLAQGLSMVPMGEGKMTRYYNGLIQGGAALVALWLFGVIVF